MKVLIGAFAATLLMGAAAFAQPTTTTAPATPAAPAAPPAPVPPSNCPTTPEPPAAPDGATANTAAWNVAAAQFNTWGQAAMANLECRRAEHDLLVRQSAARKTEHDGFVAQVRAAQAAWDAENAEFNARPARSRR